MTKKEEDADGLDWHPHDGGFGPLQVCSPADTGPLRPLAAPALTLAPSS